MYHRPKLGNKEHKVANTKGITVEHHTEHTTDGNLVVSACLDVDSRSMSKAVVLACTLPRSNGLSVWQQHLFLVVGVCIQVSLCALCEIRQQDCVQSVLGKKTLLATIDEE